MSDRVNANDWRNSKTRLLTVDATVRSLMLPPGRYFLFGDAAQIVRFAVRPCDSLGNLIAPAVPPASLPAPTAGTPAAGSLWGAGAPVSGEAEVQADATAYRHIDVAQGEYLMLYASATAAATPKLIGPVGFNMTGGELAA